jgi:hypothetical protein
MQQIFRYIMTVIKFVSDFWQVDGFLWALRFPPPIKLTTTMYIVAEILLKVALNTIVKKKSLDPGENIWEGTMKGLKNIIYLSDKSKYWSLSL